MSWEPRTAALHAVILAQARTQLTVAAWFDDGSELSVSLIIQSGWTPDINAWVFPTSSWNRCRHAVRMTSPCVYILASRRNGTLYIGVTSDLIARAWQHRNGISGGFAARYRVHRLVWFEGHDTMEQAIAREKAMKRWMRRWKVELIERCNPGWLDLYPGLLHAYSRG